MLRLRPRAWSLPILIDICFVRKKISSCKPQLSCLAFCRIKKLFIAACAIPYLFCSYPHICRYITHRRRYERASAEFSITLYLVNLSICKRQIRLTFTTQIVLYRKAMALDKGNNDNFHAFILLSRYCVSHYTQKHAGCKPWEK